MTGQLAWSMPDTVQSVVRCDTNGPLLAAAAQLWIRDADHVVDVTYGRGAFWTRYRPAHFVAHDQVTDGCDFRRLPENDETVDVVVFDPPYVEQGGRTTTGVPDFLERYGLMDGPTTLGDLRRLMAAGILEGARVLRPSGRLLVKCCDFTANGRYQQFRMHVVTVATAAGLEQQDELVHHSGTGPNGRPPPYLRSRRAHSFLCVFQKPPIWKSRKDYE